MQERKQKLIIRKHMQ